jgi:UDP-glucose 4-epimerase
VLKRRLLDSGWSVVNVDLQQDDMTHEGLRSVQGDIRDRDTVARLLTEHQVDAVFHCAAILAHAVKDTRFLWTSNVEGTRVLAREAARKGVRKLVFTSSNCLWGENLGRPVREDDQPAPVEIYGESKWEGEKILEDFGDSLDATIIRCPTIIDEGRLGLLAILFEFIDEGRKVWMVGGGGNRYQFIYAQDLAEACIRATDQVGTDVFHIGSDDVKTLRQVYEYVIAQAGTGARVATLPKGPTLFGMRAADRLKLSPLGPYHYRMIAEDFVFDTTKIKRELGWRPTLTNEEMLWRAYRHYHDNLAEIRSRTDVSAHKQAAPMGVIRLLKWVS